MIATRRQVLRAASAATLATTGGALAPRAAAQVPPAIDKIDISARAISTFHRGFGGALGRLTFRGGLVLTSAHRDFGGLSGLIVSQDGKRLLAITDVGGWVAGEITYDKQAPTGIRDARLGPLLTQAGRGVTRFRDRDAEGIALAAGNLTTGTALVAFERNHRIGRYPITNGALGVPTGFLKMPSEGREMRSNQGIEAVTVVAGGPLKGAIVAVCERFPQGKLVQASTSSSATHVGWIWGANGEPQRFTLPDIDGFDPTDIASLEDGTLILLERRFRWYEGVQMRLRLFKPGEIAPGKLAPSGETLLSADMSSEIDNMEGLAVHRDANGKTVLTLVSDDNFNAVLQRTILLQFALA